MRHTITSIDTASKSAECSVCGPDAPIGPRGVRNGVVRWTCKRGSSESSARSRRKPGYTRKSRATGRPPGRPLLSTRERRDAFSAKTFVTWQVLQVHRIEADTYEELFDAQNGCCQICSRAFSSDMKPVLDHDHSCCNGRRSCGNCIRGLLCSWCNNRVGAIENLTSSLLMDAALDYIGLRLTFD